MADKKAKCPFCDRLLKAETRETKLGTQVWIDCPEHGLHTTSGMNGFLRLKK